MTAKQQEKRGRGRPRKYADQPVLTSVVLPQDVMQQLDARRGAIPRTEAIAVAVARLLRSKWPQ